MNGIFLYEKALILVIDATYQRHTQAHSRFASLYTLARAICDELKDPAQEKGGTGKGDIFICCTSVEQAIYKMSFLML